MAELVIHPSGDLHPCASCAGHRQLTERSWSDPRFWVVCSGCGTSVGGETAEEAREAWNAQHAPREVAPADLLAYEAALLQRLLTAPVLTALDQACVLWLASGQTGGVEAFVTWCHQLTTGEVPA